MTDEELQHLAEIEQFIHPHVTFAIQAHVAAHCARSAYNKDRTLFWKNPSNTFQWMALGCVEERAIVEITEVLRSEYFRVPVEIRGKVDLGLHREVLSHPTRIEWRDRGVRALVDQNRHVLDNRAALVWRVQRSVNDELRKHGLQPKHEAVEATPAMAQSVELIWRQSMNEKGLALIPSPNRIFVELLAYHNQYIGQLERVTDAQVVTV